MQEPHRAMSGLYWIRKILTVIKTVLEHTVVKEAFSTASRTPSVESCSKISDWTESVLCVHALVTMMNGKHYLY